MITKIEGTCQYDGCDKPATVIASGDDFYNETGHPVPACYCEEHGDIVAGERTPEYITNCPNCGCRFGVN